MDRLIYWFVRALVWLLQQLPLRWVARAGRAGGQLAYWLDVRHRRVARTNLQLCFGREKSPRELRAIAREHFRRLGENYCCAVKTASMSIAQLQPHCEFVGIEKLNLDARPNAVIVAVGHFGNFELFGRFAQIAPGYRTATTYRALRQPLLNQILLTLREKSGCQFFERRTEGRQLMAALQQGNLLVGLFSDQHAGPQGVWVPFFGHDCATTPAPAIFALRYRCPLYTGFCYRVGLAQWRIEAGDVIATRDGERPRAVAQIMTDVNRSFESAVRRDPANWFWVHNRWKPRKLRKTGVVSP